MAEKTTDKQILEAAQREYESQNGTQSARDMAAYLIGYCGKDRPELAQIFHLILKAAKTNER